MKYTTAFAVPFWSGQYGLNYDYDKAIQKCEQLGSCTVDLLSYDEFKPIHNELVTRVDAVCNSIDRRFNLRIGDARIIINRPATEIRYDLESTMTLIHWMKVSKQTGRITFLAGNLMEQSKTFDLYQCQLFQSRTQFMPSTGKLVIYPSWVLNFIEESDPEDYNISLEIPLYQK